jgi:ppGpp synthetase/RelA/SpoT-type nucleotidyltranferase
MEGAVTTSLGIQSDSSFKLSTAAEDYARRRPLYTLFADEVRRILVESFKGLALKCQSIDCRAKDVESFDKKCTKKNQDGTPKYTDPLRQITDLAGVRVIVFLLRDLDRVTEFVEAHLDVREKKNIGEERFDQGAFGYQSIHYLVALPQKRLDLPDFAKYRDLICEIQIRTVLQHAWAEMEHDVQYKTDSELPKVIRKKFLSLAGLLEIADREFQGIQEEDERLKGKILESLQEDLTRSALTEKQDSPNQAGQPQPEHGVRELLSLGRYQEAIVLYDRKITDHPESYTLYVGRAKAKFLTGDTTGAIADLDRAEGIKPESRDVRLVRDQIVEGTVYIAPISLQNNKSNELQNVAREKLSKGLGEEAFVLFSEAQEAGANWAFSTFNKAMSCVVANDYEGGRLHLDRLRIISGTPMEINIRALRAIIDVCEGSRNVAECVPEIERLVRDKGDYSFGMSPLVALKAGLAVSMDQETNDNLMKVFEVLTQS